MWVSLNDVPSRHTELFGRIDYRTHPGHPKSDKLLGLTPRQSYTGSAELLSAARNHRTGFNGGKVLGFSTACRWVNKQEHAPHQYDVAFADGRSAIFWETQLEVKSA